METFALRRKNVMELALLMGKMAVVQSRDVNY